MARASGDLPVDPAIVLLNPDDEVTPQAFQAWLNRRQAGEPIAPLVTAAETLDEARRAEEA